jgi:hypothetical protein
LCHSVVTGVSVHRLCLFSPFFFDFVQRPTRIDKAKNLTDVIFTREKSNLFSTKTDQLEWRRNKVIELRAIDLSYQEIARELQVSKTSIVSDVQYLREQAKVSIKEYVTEHLPEQYQICLCALDTILKHTFEILQTSHDNREKLQLWKSSRIRI